MPEHPELISPAQSKPPYFVGIDLGGSSIKVGLVDDEGRPLAYFHIPTEVARGPEDGARRMGESVDRVTREAGVAANDVNGVGLGSPGTMDIPAGLLIRPHNFPGWFNFPIRDRVSHYCGRPVVFANDACAAAYGEYWVGSGQTFHSMLLLTLGTGIGGGIVIGDVVIEGEHSHGAECGHTTIDYRDEARNCLCGQKGHLEAYGSATAVMARAQEALEQGRTTSLATRRERGDDITPLVLAQEAEAGDGLALEIIGDTAKYLGIGIASIVHTIDPDGVVLGGGMTFGGVTSPLGRSFLESVRAEFRRRAFPVLAEKVAIDFASLGSDAGYIGAAGMARLKFRKGEGG